MSTVFTFVRSFRNPQYTGPNRCLPCTVTNVAIAGVGSLALAVFEPLLGVVAFLAALTAIYFRGYLVPGTPAFTARYFPDWLLARFDKVEPFDFASYDTETTLREAGVVVDDATGSDLVLDADFERAWYERMAAMDGGATDRDELAALVDLDPAAFTIERFGDAVVASVDDARVGRWESRAAFVADVTAARELDARYPAWRSFPLAVRSELLGGLRLFLDRCPTCDGDVTVGQEVVKSCCRSYDVVAVSCSDCGARLLEADFDPGVLEGDDELAADPSLND
ncbi:MAG: hypothetical protein ABEJ82_08485 [Haloplanus sp.]